MTLSYLFVGFVATAIIVYVFTGFFDCASSFQKTVSTVVVSVLIISLWLWFCYNLGKLILDNIWLLQI